MHCGNRLEENGAEYFWPLQAPDQCFLLLMPNECFCNTRMKIQLLEYVIPTPPAPLQ